MKLVLVGTITWGTIFLEVPTGVLADLYSRRFSVVIGYALIGFCFVIEGGCPFTAIILAEVVCSALDY